MRVEAYIKNFNPPPLCKLADILAALRGSGKHKAMIFLGQVQYKDGRREDRNRGWVTWYERAGIFVDPLETDFHCWEADVDAEVTNGRLLQAGEGDRPEEVFVLHYHGEDLTPAC